MHLDRGTLGYIKCLLILKQVRKLRIHEGKTGLRVGEERRLEEVGQRPSGTLPAARLSAESRKRAYTMIAMKGTSPK